ncbi:hypothetical protein B0H11DRAFT_2163167 [Mycena galericulata]|nr:hypothetical protein B0H11DRAFT_2163167 [Mycena galericulata]
MFIKLVGFATGVFANWAPNLFNFYVDYMGEFSRKNKQLQHPFIKSIWSACTFNLGPYTCALGHRDFVNLAAGNLILWDCKFILEFPPGTTILIPSASIYHSNIPISKGEHRYSFTQYTAGGLFRWVERGYKTEEEYMASLTPEEIVEEHKLGLERAMEGAGMFSTLAELQASSV